MRNGGAERLDSCFIVNVSGIRYSYLYRVCQPATRQGRRARGRVPYLQDLEEQKRTKEGEYSYSTSKVAKSATNKDDTSLQTKLNRKMIRVLVQ